MVTNTRQLDSIYAALADRTRRAILTRLALGESTVGALAEPFAMSRPAISKHLRVLEGAGLVRRTRVGRVSRCQANPDPLDEATDWLERYRRTLEERLDRLDSYLQKLQRKEKGHGHQG